MVSDEAVYVAVGRAGDVRVAVPQPAYEELEPDYVYKSFTTNLAAAIGGIRALDIRGRAISMPFKEAVIPLLDELDASARPSTRSTRFSTTGDG